MQAAEIACVNYITKEETTDIIGDVMYHTEGELAGHSPSCTDYHRYSQKTSNLYKQRRSRDRIPSGLDHKQNSSGNTRAEHKIEVGI